jgi:hypothetical protein
VTVHDTLLERYKVSISTLHDARSAVIAELYAKHLEVWRSWEQVQSSGADDATRMDMVRDAIRANSDFRSLYFQSRLYLTTNALELLFRVLQSFQQMSSVAQLDTARADVLIVNAYRRMDDTLLGLQQPLETEFRLILGTEDIINSIR